MDPQQVSTDAELGQQAGSFLASFSHPEVDPEGLYTRVARVLGVVRPEVDTSKVKVEPGITVPLIQTLQRAETMSHELRTRLIWGLYRNTNWSLQDPSGQMFYGHKPLPDGDVEIVMVDRLAQEFEKHAATAASSSSPPPPSSLWTRITRSEWFVRWYPIYQTLCTMYTVWLCIVLLPKPLPPRSEGPIAILWDILQRTVLLVLAFFFAPLVLLLRFLATYRIVLRSTLAKNPLLGQR